MIYPEFYINYRDKFKKLNMNFWRNLLIFAIIGWLLGFFIKNNLDIYFYIWIIFWLLFWIMKELPWYIHDIVSIYIEDLEKRTIKWISDIKK